MITLELTPEQLHNICACLIRAAKAPDTTDVEMVYLMNLQTILKAKLTEGNGTVKAALEESE